MTDLRARRRVTPPAVLTGFGLGAFLDGIVLHQVLQWHHLVSEYRPVDDLRDLEVNTFWDGVFHLGAWVLVVAGLVWLMRLRDVLPAVGRRPLAGLVLIGWGSFNVVDQVVFHLLLEAHHIRMVDSYQVYDWGYTVLGVLIASAGLLLVRGRSR